MRFCKLRFWLKERPLYLRGSILLPSVLVLWCAACLWRKTDGGGFRAGTHGKEEARGLANLDVVVTDNSGTPISNLGLEDFALLDNGQPQRIISFHEFDGISSKPDPPVRVILLIDTFKMPFDRLPLSGRKLRSSCGGTAVIWVSPFRSSGFPIPGFGPWPRLPAMETL